MTNFSDISISLTKQLSKKEKKDNGIFFTPKSIIKNAMTNNIFQTQKFNNILEPSCGSCEFIDYIKSNDKIKYKTITGVEFNKTIYETIKSKYDNETNITIINDDFLNYKLDTQTPETYDLIIGNPPYFVLKKDAIDEKYNKYYSGRPNIFIIFIIKCIMYHLSKNGVLCFVIPSSFLNSSYYNKIREYIYKNMEIVDIIHNKEDEYIDTKQHTITLIIKNITSPEIKKSNTNFVLKYKNETIFNSKSNIVKLNKLVSNTKTLKDLGFSVYVGKCVWNQNKPLLTDDNTKTKLIYSGNIKNNTLVDLEVKREGDEKKQYIDKPGTTGPVLVLNRGYGVGTYNFNYCIIDVKYEYLIENHLIVIEGNEIIQSFKNKKTTEFISLFVGNSALNTSEIHSALPIFEYK
jgi:DNA (cytosine-5)-methyltransferase 1